MATRTLPKGESPDEAIERIAPQPIHYAVNITGYGDNGDTEAIRAAFARFVRKLRTAGVTVGGALTGNVAGVVDPATNTASERVVLHDLAENVTDKVEPDKPAKD